MKEVVKVTKITNRSLMLSACEATFAGKSNQSLLSIYKSEHSPARTQLFWIECENIPLYVSTHLLRHHVGSQPFALTHRTDRKGGGYDIEKNCDRVKALMIEKDSCNDIERSKAVTDEINGILDNLSNYGGRNTPTNLSLLINAQSLIDMAKLRLCKQASPHTIKVFTKIKEAIRTIDPDLASLMVVKCVYRNGICGEPKPCGFMKTPIFRKELKEYLDNFSENQTMP